MEVGEIWKFRQTFRDVLNRVKAAYPAATGIEEYEGGLVLPHAPPPVPPTRSLRRIKG